MRTVAIALLVLTVLAAVMAGSAALGLARLRQLHAQARTATPPPAAAGAPGDAAAATHPEDWAIPAASSLPGEAPAANVGAEVVAEQPRRDAGPIVLPALEATVRGREIRVELEGPRGHIAGWRDKGALAAWDLAPRRQGRYAVHVCFSCGDRDGGDFLLTAAGQQIEGRARPTGGSDVFQTVVLGAVSLPAGGATLVLQGGERSGDELMRLREVRLVPLP